MQDFFTGDVVRYKRKDSFFRAGDIHIIDNCSYCGEGTFEYSTDLGAWFTASDFDLIRRADRESFKQLDKSKEDNDMEY